MLNRELQRRTEEIRRALLTDTESDQFVTFDQILFGHNGFDNFIKWISQKIPFKKDIHTVHARFGGAVASYFIFCRYVFVLFVIIGALLITFGTFHALSIYTSSSPYKSANSFLPSFMLHSSFQTDEKISYTIMVVIILTVTLLALCVKIVAEDKEMKTLDAYDAISGTPYANLILCAWDNSTVTKSEVDDLKLDLSNRIAQQMEENNSLGLKKRRSRREEYIMMTRRVVGFILYFVLIASAFTLIIFFTINSKQIASSFPSLPGVGSIGSLISPFVLESINTATPLILNWITSFEMWDSGQTELNLILFRMYLSNTLNTVILALTYILLADPLLLASLPQLRTDLELPISSAYDCRIDQVADALFSLMILTWFFRVVLVAASPIATNVFRWVRGKPWERSEFQVAEQMVKLLSFLGIVFLNLSFAPLSMVFVPFCVYFGTKWEIFWVNKLYSKPKRSWRAHRAAIIYSFFFFVTFLLVGVSTSGYFMYCRTLSKSCEIQDAKVHLCLYDYNDLTSQTCTTDASSKYYSLYSSNYPASVCSTSCGPFVDIEYPAYSLLRYTDGSFIFSAIWYCLFLKLFYCLQFYKTTTISC